TSSRDTLNFGLLHGRWSHNLSTRHKDKQHRYRTDIRDQPYRQVFPPYSSRRGMSRTSVQSHTGRTLPDVHSLSDRKPCNSRARAFASYPLRSAQLVRESPLAAIAAAIQGLQSGIQNRANV